MYNALYKHLVLNVTISYVRNSRLSDHRLFCLHAVCPCYFHLLYTQVFGQVDIYELGFSSSSHFIQPVLGLGRAGVEMGDDLTVIVETGDGADTGRPVLYEQVVIEIMLQACIL